MKIEKRLFKTFLLILFFLRGWAVAQTTPQVIPLWPKGAPGFEKLRDQPEVAKDYYVKNVNNPSLTVFLPPKNLANGTAIIVCPGGGFRLLVYTSEGLEPAKFLNSLGITVFVLKYRLPREENSPYNLDVQPKEDGMRAMRLVKSRAKEFGIDENRIGMMGFSAGGEVVDAVTFNNTGGNAAAADPVDRIDAKPNFIVQIYPGPLFIPDTISPNSPTAFLAAADDDACCSVTIIKLMELYRAAKVPVEMHLFAQGDHAFNMGQRSKYTAVNNWPKLLGYWLADRQIIPATR